VAIAEEQMAASDKPPSNFEVVVFLAVCLVKGIFYPVAERVSKILSHIRFEFQYPLADRWYRWRANSRERVAPIAFLLALVGGALFGVASGMWEELCAWLARTGSKFPRGLGMFTGRR
jgi:hypothetical protein